MNTLAWILAVSFLALLGHQAESCSLLFPDVCKNVTCPNGVACQSDASYWSEHRIGGVSLPPLARCEDSDPCVGHVCRLGTRCVKVKDSCDAQGICTVKAQCNEINRPGKCPKPENIHVHSCMNSCRDDAFCEGNAKCCRSKSTGGKWCAHL
ncbi:papilin-like [Paramacrobiotus metropolitanus]|uniref:papilin-like n=1 Tax=Paramacrobiotus metropolitanus TaxID=2943436 RepID=UPI002445D1CD|nr:papilin-like [Paramacrobiotus metropolitanus]